VPGLRGRDGRKCDGPALQNRRHVDCDREVAARPAMCRECGASELENVAMSLVDKLLAVVDRSAELEVVRYAA
jgi:hypothetical protein